MYSKAGMAIFATSEPNSEAKRPPVLVEPGWRHQWLSIQTGMTSVNDSLVYLDIGIFSNSCFGRIWCLCLDLYLVQFLLGCQGHYSSQLLRQPFQAAVLWIGPSQICSPTPDESCCCPYICHVPTGQHCAQFDRSSTAVRLLHGYVHHCQQLNGPPVPVPHQGVASASDAMWLWVVSTCGNCICLCCCLLDVHLSPPMGRI